MNRYAPMRDMARPQPVPRERVPAPSQNQTASAAPLVAGHRFGQTSILQRKCADCAKEGEEKGTHGVLMRAPEPGVTSDTPTPTVAAPTADPAPIELKTPTASGSTTFTLINKTRSVSGATLTAVGNAATDNGAREAASVKPAFTPAPQYEFDDNDHVTKATVRVEETKEMPVWAERDAQCEPIQKEWDRFHAALDAHENHHVAIDRKHFENLHTRLIGKASADAYAAVDAAIDAADKENEAYDNSTNHGIKEGTAINGAVQCAPEKVQSTSLWDDAVSEVGELFAKQEAGGVGGQAAPPIVSDVLANSGGEPLAPDVRAFMEPRFGHDFSVVRIHTDARASESAQAVQARAYAVGNDVVFRAGEYAPQTTPGRHLLAHELAHTVQQGATTPLLQRAMTISQPGDPLEIEADRMADIVMRTEIPGAQTPLVGTPALTEIDRSADILQRDPAPTPAPAPGVSPPSPPPPGSPAPAPAPNTAEVDDGLVHIGIDRIQLEKARTKSFDVMKALGFATSSWSREVTLADIPIPELGVSFVLDFAASVTPNVSGTLEEIALTNIRLGMTKTTAIAMGAGALLSAEFANPAPFLLASRLGYISGFGQLHAGATVDATLNADAKIKAGVKLLGTEAVRAIPSIADVEFKLGASVGAHLGAKIDAMTEIVFDQGSLNIANAAALKAFGSASASLNASLNFSGLFGLIHFGLDKSWNSTMGFDASTILGDFEVAHNGLTNKNEDKIIKLNPDTFGKIVDFVRDSMLSDNGPGKVKENANGPDQRTDSEKQAAADAAAAEVEKFMNAPEATIEDVQEQFPNLQQKYRLSALEWERQLDEQGREILDVVVRIDSGLDTGSAPTPDFSLSIRNSIQNSLAARQAILAKTNPHYLPRAGAITIPPNAPAIGSYVISLTSVSGEPIEDTLGRRRAGTPDIGARSKAYKITSYKEHTEGGQRGLYAHWAVLSLNIGQNQIIEEQVGKGERVDNLAGGAFRINCTEAEVIEALTTFNFLQPGTLQLLFEYQGSEAIRGNFYGTKYKRYGQALFNIQHDQARAHETYDSSNPLAAYAWLCPGPNDKRTAPGPSAHVVYAPYYEEPTTIDHIMSVAEHWNSTGSLGLQAERDRWDDDVNNLQLMDRTHNSSKGSSNIQFTNKVGSEWRGPGNLK